MMASSDEPPLVDGKGMRSIEPIGDLCSGGFVWRESWSKGEAAVTSLCFTCAASQNGKVPDFQQRQKTFFSPPSSCTLLTTCSKGGSVRMAPGGGPRVTPRDEDEV